MRIYISGSITGTDDYCNLKKLLEEGYKVIMCNALTKDNGETELEYILEKEC